MSISSHSPSPSSSHRPASTTRTPPPTLFDLNIKMSGQLITLPVTSTDSDISLTEKLLDRFPGIDRELCRGKVRAKVVDSLSKLRSQYGVAPGMRNKIRDFLQKCEIEVSICLNQEDQTSRKTSLKKAKSKQKSTQKLTTATKQKKKKKKKKQFTKLYQLRKQIFQQPCPLQQQKQNLSRIMKKVSRSRHSHNNNSRTLQKQQESQILRRIQNKLNKYTTVHKLESGNKKNTMGEDNNINNLTSITEPYPQKQHNFDNNLTSDMNKSRSRSRYRYNYEQIITERQLSQRKILTKQTVPLQQRQKQNNISRNRRASYNYMSQQDASLIQNPDGLRYNYYSTRTFNNNNQNLSMTQSKQKLKYHYLEQFDNEEVKGMRGSKVDRNLIAGIARQEGSLAVCGSFTFGRRSNFD